ncbi:IS200/IS605 family transposase [Flavobacterium sp. MFBS3-15]|uniref:IS200/IS605 family transposase n=1 Tax=Flavobacterium sp. MFBS3-15 TaxID=2989816 RepID=UPI002236A585|nr:IS200/IS605 family transposase [Flavobacterium sp. MFBS3-15]MCW4469612.1 IS200/IS605 family transposase [Flavobacterium sp. MFBS3-15]
MPNTYTQIHIQFVFAVKYRHGIIAPQGKQELYSYISGIIEKQGHKLLAINVMPDHIHIFIGMRPNQSVSDLLQDIKRNSSLWINQKGVVSDKFEWQEGYGAFSYSKSHTKAVIEYIENQEIHLRRSTFKDEYLDFLRKFEIDYDERYIFDDLID